MTQTLNLVNQWGVAQFGRVLGLGPRCRRFESCRLDHFFQFMIWLEASNRACALLLLLSLHNTEAVLRKTFV